MLRRIMNWITGRGYQGPPLMQIVRGLLGDSVDVKTPYKDSPWIYRALRYKADNIARLPIRMMTGVRGDPQQKQVAKDHPFNAVLERPNLSQNGYEFQQTCVLQIESSGACFIVMPDRLPNKLPTMMIPRGPTGWKRIKDDAGITRAWELTAGSKTLTFAPWEIILLRYVDPDDPDGWLSPLQALRRGIAASFAGEVWNENIYRNSGMPKGALETDRGIDNVLARRLLMEWNDLYGGAANAGKVAILQGGLKFKPYEISPHDMEWVQSQTWNRDLIFVGTGVWPEVFGFGSTTYANRAEARRDVWESTLLPMLQWSELAYWSQLFWSVDQGRYWMEYDTSAVIDLQTDMATRIENSSKLWSLGVPMEQCNRRFTLGLEPYEGWEISYLPSSIITATDAALDLADGGSEDITEEDQDDAMDYLGRSAERLSAAASLLIEQRSQEEEPCPLEGVEGSTITPERAREVWRETKAVLAEQVAAAAQAEAAMENGQASEPEPPEAQPVAPEPPEPATETEEPNRCECCEGGDSGGEEGWLPFVGELVLPDFDGETERECNPAASVTIGSFAIGPCQDEPETRSTKTDRGPGGRRYLRDFRALEKRMASKLKRHFHQVRSALLKRMAELDDGARAIETTNRMVELVEECIGEDRRAWLDEEQTERALSKADADRLIREVFGDAAITEELRKATRPIYRDAVRAGALQVITESGDGKEDLWKPSREQLAILRRRGTEITGIEETTRKRIVAVLAKGLAAEENLTGLQDRVRSAFNSTNARALLIARTEVGGAMNEARDEQHQREGIEYHEWVSSGDSATRESHAAVDGEVRRIGEKFSNGLRYPNDPEGPASEVCNCRCRTIGVQKPKS